MSNFTEYVFCPYCGGITAPGTCVNCGKLTDIGIEETNGSQQPTENAQSGRMYGQNMQMNQNGQMYGAYQQPINTYAMQEPSKKKSRWWLWLIIITGVLFLGLIIAIILIIVFFAMSFVNDTNAGVSTIPVVTQPQVAVSEMPITEEEPDSYEYDSDDTGEYYGADEFAMEVYQRANSRIDFSYLDYEAYFNSANYYADFTDGSNDIFLKDNYMSTFGSNHNEHSADEFTGEYFEPFVDCIDDSYDYNLIRHYMEYMGKEDDIYVNAFIAYYQLEGEGIPNLDALNEEIYLITVNDLFSRLEGYTDYGWYTGETTIIVDSFVPYNDGEKMSILLDITIAEGDMLADSYIYGINIDLVNGEIMDNGSILNVDTEFAAMFREKCCAQNGPDIDGLNYLEDDELVAFLSNDSTNIVFYSPYGLEVGYAYETSEGSKGWMTITMMDYEEYLQ